MCNNIILLFNELPWYKKLRILQFIAGWTQNEAAVRYGTTQKNVWAWTQGKQVPQRYNRSIIAKVHGLNITDIFPVEMLKPDELSKGA